MDVVVNHYQRGYEITEKYIQFWYLEPGQHFFYLRHHCWHVNFEFLRHMWLLFAVVLSFEFLFKYPNPGLTGIIICMSFGNPFLYLLDSIWNINLCCHWIGTWKSLWLSNWVPFLLFSWLGTWRTNWHFEGSFNWKLSGQGSWGISWIVFLLLFDLTLEALFESDSWYNFFQFIVDISLGSKVGYPN